MTPKSAEEIIRQPKYEGLKNLVLICEALDEMRDQYRSPSTPEKKEKYWQAMSDQACDELDINNKYIGRVFQWILKNSEQSEKCRVCDNLIVFDVDHEPNCPHNPNYRKPEDEPYYIDDKINGLPPLKEPESKSVVSDRVSDLLANERTESIDKELMNLDNKDIRISMENLKLSLVKILDDKHLTASLKSELSNKNLESAVYYCLRDSNTDSALRESITPKEEPQKEEDEKTDQQILDSLFQEWRAEQSKEFPSFDWFLLKIIQAKTRGAQELRKEIEKGKEDHSWISVMKQLIPLAEDGYKAAVRSGHSHQEFLQDDRDLLAKAKELVSTPPKS